MKATLTKELANKKRRNLMTLQLEEVDEFIISNFQNELDLEMYFASVSIDNISDGKFLIVSNDKGKEIEHKMFYRSDFENIKDKIEIGTFDKERFANILNNRCPDLFTNDGTDLVDQLIDKLNDETILKNFRNVYYSIREYSIIRIEEYQKVKTKTHTKR